MGLSERFVSEGGVSVQVDPKGTGQYVSFRSLSGGERAAVAFLLMLQRSIFLTRAGAKIKTGYNSQEADAWAKLQQAAMSCHLALVELRKVPGADASAEVLDVCKIYFKSNFFSL